MKKPSILIQTLSFISILSLLFPNTTHAAARATGGTYTESGGYGIHTFTSTGTFTPDSLMDVEYLVIGGGGGGGKDNWTETRGSGGGGGGGFRTGSNHSVSIQGYSITVGGGGTAGVGNVGGGSGGNSVFDSITSLGGGGGGTHITSDPWNNGPFSGSSGGGAVNQVSDGDTGAAGTAGQGYAGGDGSGTPFDGGGGGGSSAVGNNGPNGTGGAGTANSISGSSVTYAGGGGAWGGGGGKSGGAGGGGNGGTNGTAGTTNKGGGGGGGRTSAGAGGSGVVIIKYTLTVPPTAPTIGTATVISDTSIQWNFTDNSDDETGFKVYDTSDTLKATCASANISSCTETGLTGNTTYTRKVVAYNGDGNSGYSSTDSATTNISSCAPPLGDSTHSVTTDCSFTGYTDASNGSRIVSGLDSGTGTTNTAVLTIDTGTLTINSNETLVTGSLELGGGSVAIAEGAIMLIGGSLWGIDADGDGYSETTTFYAQTTTPTNGVRINTITDVTIADCDEGDAGSNTSCCTAVDLYTDADGDGYGIGSSSLNACPQSGYSNNNTDCNDTGTNSTNVFISASCYIDADDDGHGSTTTVSCTDNATCLSATWGSNGVGTTASAGDFTNTNNTDCNDGNASKYTNNWECDSCPNYCCTDGVVNSGGTCGSCASGPIGSCNGPYDVWNDPPTCYCHYVNESHICSWSSCNCGWVCGT